MLLPVHGRDSNTVTTINSVKIKLSEKVDLSKFLREIVLAVILYTHFTPDIIVDIFRRYTPLHEMRSVWNVGICSSCIDKILLSHFFVVMCCVMFPEIISKVYISWCPIKKKLILMDAILDPMKAHVHSLGTFLFDVTIPSAVELSVAIGVDGWIWPISMRAWRSGTASCSLWKSAPNSVSAVEAIILRRVLQNVKTGPLVGGEGWSGFVISFGQ